MAYLSAIFAALLFARSTGLRPARSAAAAAGRVRAILRRHRSRKYFSD